MNFKSKIGNEINSSFTRFLKLIFIPLHSCWLKEVFLWLWFWTPVRCASIFSETGINWACPVLPNIAVPWHPWSMRFSACSRVFSTFRLKLGLRTDIDAAKIPLIFDISKIYIKAQAIVFGIVICASILTFQNAKAQTISMDQLPIEDALRRLQLMGKIESDISFMSRPLQPTKIGAWDSALKWLDPVYFKKGLHPIGKKFLGISFLDVSTGEFLTSQGTSEYIDKLLQNFNPSEVLVQKQFKNKFNELFV